MPAGQAPRKAKVHLISAILLSAGASHRMGSPKALLKIGAKTFLQTAVEQLLASRADEVLVVSGAKHGELDEELRRTVSSAKLRHVWNPHFAQGMMSSIQTGVRALDPRSQGFMLTLVDLPFLQTGDYDLLLGARATGANRLVRFRYQQVPAHPVFIPISFRDEILEQQPGPQGCAFLFADGKNPVTWLEATSPRGLIDIDTPEDYLAHFPA